MAEALTTVSLLRRCVSPPPRLPLPLNLSLRLARCPPHERQIVKKDPQSSSQRMATAAAARAASPLSDAPGASPGPAGPSPTNGRRQRASRDPLADLRREVAVMRRALHPNVVALREVGDRAGRARGPCWGRCACEPSAAGALNLRSMARQAAQTSTTVWGMGGVHPPAHTPPPRRATRHSTEAVQPDPNTVQVVDDCASNKMLLVMDYLEGGPVMTREGLGEARVGHALARLPAVPRACSAGCGAGCVLPCVPPSFSFPFACFTSV